MKGIETSNDHEKLKELAACAVANALTDFEWIQLTSHLSVCGECEEVYQQYRNLATEAIPSLAVVYADREAPRPWDCGPLRKELFKRIKTLTSEQMCEPRTIAGRIGHRRLSRLFVPVGAAAVFCILATTGFVEYRSHRQRPNVMAQVQDSAAKTELQDTVGELTRLLDVQSRRTTQLEAKNSQKQQAVTKLNVEVQSLIARITDLDAASRLPSEELQEITRERDSLEAQLLDAKKAYKDAQAELATVRIDRDELLRRSGLLESKIKEISTTASTQEDRLAEFERFMASDRDIRELMGARKLYIADVFDVDGYSRTQKPFGRIFYTEGKSLIFYAFDLEDRSGKTTASAFQVWGQAADVSNPVNLGILYMDNASNRRWLLRVDDPEQLARINSVFVTVEPHGGSQRPTGKPFLYALLWQKANHP